MTMFPAPLRRLLFALLGGALACLSGLALIPPASVAAATTYTVNVITDTGAGSGTIGDLRFAITQVNASTGGTIDITATGRIRLGSALPALAKSVRIIGSTSGAGVAVDGGCTFSNGSCMSGTGVMVFTVNSGVTATISNLTIRRGNGATFGGGIDNSGTLTVTDSTLSTNSATFGGAIYNQGTLTVTNSTLSGNSATEGGGIYNQGTLTVTDSTLSANSASSGGGIDNLIGSLTVTNSTLSGNSATNGGGIENGGTLTVTNSTLSANSTIIGGGIDNSGALTPTNTIVAGNIGSSGGPDVEGTVTSHGHNLIGNTSGGSGYVASDLKNVNPQLGTLGSNGGTTRTIPLLTGSPAIGAGDPAVCAAAPVGGEDQRGVFRQAGACSIGAFEAQPATPTPLPPTKPPGPAGGPPNPLPVSRPTGPTAGTAPSPLPAPRP